MTNEYMEWEYLDPPFCWKEIDDFVIADRHLPDGTRQHMVKGHVHAGKVVCNAQVIGQNDEGSLVIFEG